MEPLTSHVCSVSLAPAQCHWWNNGANYIQDIIPRCTCVSSSKSPINTEFVKEPLTSVAPCLADANDLAEEPATTAEDTQCTLQSIISDTGSAFCCLSVCLAICLTATLSISHAYLGPCLHLCHLSFLPPPVPKTQSSSTSFAPNTFYTFISPSLNYPFPLSITHSIHLNLFLSPPHLPPPPSLSLSLHCPWVGVNNVGPRGGPSAVPAEKAGSTREHINVSAGAAE